MAETFEAPRDAPATRPDSLLATKLHLPLQPPGLVARPRLMRLLDQGLTHELTLVCAPAGVGKTVVLADWCQRRPHQVAWLSLDAADSDPARFWRHVAAALDRVRPGIAQRIEPLLGWPAPVFDGVVTAVVNHLAADAGEVALVLDDYHLIDAQPVHGSLQLLLANQPPGLHLTLATRADPPLPLARLRARGQLNELRTAELRFTTDEAAALLRAGVSSDLPSDAIAALAVRTEGWAAGLQLAALSLHGRSDIAEFVETFSGSHRYVLDYLTEEVLEQQPEQVREFLLETSVLERLSGPLCDAVTGRGDSQQKLEAIEKANLFLVALDDVRGWWRYHHLFADLLRARLQQRYRPERVRELHRNAAAWHEEQAQADEAVRHAVAAGDSAWAARLIERYADEVFVRSEGDTMRRWLAPLSAELVASRPRLQLTHARMALLAGDVDAVEGMLEAAERAFQLTGEEPYEPSLGRAASPMSNVPALIAANRAFIANLRGEPEEATAFASRALAELDPDEWMLDTFAHAHLGTAEWLRGQLVAAHRTITSSITRWRAAGMRDLAALWSYSIGQIQRAQGRMDAALDTYEHVHDALATQGEQSAPAAGVAYIGTADVAYQRDDLDTALRRTLDGLPLCRQLAYTQPWANGLVTLAWIRQAQGDATSALEAMNEAERIADSGVTDLINPVPAQRARLLLAQGDFSTARDWTTQRGIDPDDEPDYAREPAYLVLARLLLAHGLPDRALGLLDRMHAKAVAQERTGSVIEIKALRSVALADTGDHEAAGAVLADALALAWPQGYIRVFADEGRTMGALVGRLIANQRSEPDVARAIPLHYLGRVAQAFEHDAPSGSTDRDQRPSSIVAPLSDREIQVLRLMAAGRRNQEIADELYVALNTVKKHVTHVFEKLGAANRTEATARARELGLLD